LKEIEMSLVKEKKVPVKRNQIRKQEPSSKKNPSLQSKLNKIPKEINLT